MSNCRTSPKNLTCNTKPVGGTENSGTVCTPFSMCLPFGGSLTYDGDCLNYTAGSSIPDGEYGVVVIENGCIANVKSAPIPVYTPPSCTPAVQDCSGSGTGVGITLQPDACNLLGQDASGRLGAYVNMQAGSNVGITGCGTASNPFVLSVTVPEAMRTYLGSADTSTITVTGTGTVSDPYYVGMVQTEIGAGVYGAYTFDKYGRLVDYDDSVSTGITAVLAGPGVNVISGGGVVTVGLEESEQDAGDTLFGGYTVHHDVAGRITDITQTINIPEGTYDLYDIRATFNALGSVTAMQRVIRQDDSRFSKIFNGPRDATQFAVSTTMAGHLRIVYRGDLGTASASTTGIISLPAPWYVTVNDTTVNAYAVVTGGRVTEVHVMTSELYQPGSYIIQLAGNPPSDADPNPFKDTAIMDVSFISAGA